MYLLIRSKVYHSYTVRVVGIKDDSQFIIFNWGFEEINLFMIKIYKCTYFKLADCSHVISSSPFQLMDRLYINTF